MNDDGRPPKEPATANNTPSATAPATGAGARLDSTGGLSGYVAAAQVYWNKGWRGVLPLKRGTKSPPPQGFTGNDGADPSYADVLQWSELYPEGNVAMRLADGVIGIDVDAYGTKTGGETLAEAERRWGPLPDGPRSSSRADDPVSGIRLFRVPAGTRLVTMLGFPELGVGDVEMIQRHHRYAMCWPSIHPDTGQMYQWRRPDGTVSDPPAVDDLPALPPEWLAGMTDDDAASVNARTEDRADIGACLTEGGPSQRVADRLNTALAACAGSSRHDNTRNHVLALLRFGRQNEPGVKTAVVALGQQFIAAVTADGSRTPDAARSEFRRMVYGDRVAAELAYDDTDWIRRLTERAAANGQATTIGRLEQVTAEPASGDSPPGIDEEAFWNSCDELRSCRDYARSVRVGPWAMLGAALASVAATIPPFVVLPAEVGSYASVNLYVALCGPSGSIKSAAIAAARDWLATTPRPTEVKPGSGQGIAKCFAYVKTEGKAKIPVQVGKLWSAVAVIGEVDTLTAAGRMTGSNLWAELRAGWSAERIGHDYADATKTVVLQPHRYRLCMVVGVQPLRAAPLFDDTDAGTPQRFVWMPTDDPGAPEIRPAPTPALALPPWSLPQDDGGFFTPPSYQWADRLAEPPDPSEFIVLRIPDEARAMIDEMALSKLQRRPGAKPIDGHRLQGRLRVAAALARLRQHDDEVTDEDWQLAGTVMAVSDRTRAGIQSEIDANAAARNARTAQASGARKVIEAGVVADAEAADISRVADLIVAALTRADGGALSGSAVRQALGTPRNRALADKALEYLKVDGRIIVENIEYRRQQGVRVTLQQTA